MVWTYSGTIGPNLGESELVQTKRSRGEPSTLKRDLGSKRRQRIIRKHTVLYCFVLLTLASLIFLHEPFKTRPGPVKIESTRFDVLVDGRGPCRALRFVQLQNASRLKL